MHFKKIMGAITLSTALLLSACGGNNEPQNPVNTGTESNISNNQEPQSTTNAPENDKTNNSSSSLAGIKFTAEDNHQANFGNIDDYILYENNVGIFYTTGSTTGPDLHFYDKETKKSIYLCNKPECPHDGNEFCAATNKKYTVLRRASYNDKILMLAYEEKTTQTEFKILCASMDGSSLEELTTFYTSDTFGLVPNKETYNFNDDAPYISMVIHRNKVIASISLKSDTLNLEDSPEYFGSCIIDLNTKETKFLTETPLATDNAKVKNIICHGDYIFFSTITQGKPSKKTLCRYNVNTNEIEEFKPQGFKGYFSVYDDDSIIYTRPMASKVTLYSLSQNIGKEYAFLYSDPYIIPEHPSNVLHSFPDGSTKYEDIIMAPYYVEPRPFGTDLMTADENHVYAWYAWGTNGYFYTHQFIQYDEMEQEEANFGQHFTMNIYRFDKDIAHYAESETAFTLPMGEDGLPDVTAFGKDPGNEFEIVDLRKVIDYKSKPNVYEYYISLLNDQIYLCEHSKESGIWHTRYYFSDADSFFSGTPEWVPYIEW